MAYFQAVDPRAVFVVTDDNLPSAVDRRIEYRPHETPGNQHFVGDAVDTGGTLRGSSGKIRVVAFSAVQSHRLGVLKTAQNAFVAAEQALEDLGS